MQPAATDRQPTGRGVRKQSKSRARTLSAPSAAERDIDIDSARYRVFDLAPRLKNWTLGGQVRPATAITLVGGNARSDSCSPNSSRTG
jgi:hypothetical protein